MNPKLCAALLTFLLTWSCSNGAFRPGCSLSVNNGRNEKLLPVLLYNYTDSFELVVPVRGTIDLDSGEGLTFVCPDPKNYITATNSNATFAICAQGSTLKISRDYLNFDDIRCNKQVHGDIIKTGETCGSGIGRIIFIGYHVNRYYWKTLIKVCYNEIDGRTFYTEHTIHGEEIRYASKSSLRPSFSTAGLGPDIAASIAYKQVFQKSTFNKLLGSSRSADRYINGRSYLARGHLSPDADFLFASSQFTSYYYINTCPQWQAINGGNWKSVEITVRKTAEQYEDTFTIITGTYGILELPDANNHLTKIYLLSGNRLPVPKFLWKIMFNEKTSEGIVLIVLNNPFADKLSEDDWLCQDVCQKYGWSFRNWPDFSRGYVYCCNINDFTNKVDEVPYLRVKGVLQGLSNI